MIDSKQVKDNFGRTVRELRETKKLTQEKLAEFINVDPHTISSIERGKVFPTFENLISLCNVFEVEPVIFFTKKVRILSQDDIDLMKSMKRTINSLSSDKLQLLHDIMLVIQK